MALRAIDGGRVAPDPVKIIIAAGDAGLNFGR